jgi:hypothetical protein
MIKWRRTTASLVGNSGFVLHSSFVIRISSFGMMAYPPCNFDNSFQISRSRSVSFFGTLI